MKVLCIDNTKKEFSKSEADNNPLCKNKIYNVLEIREGKDEFNKIRLGFVLEDIPMIAFSFDRFIGLELDKFPHLYSKRKTLFDDRW